MARTSKALIGRREEVRDDYRLTKAEWETIIRTNGETGAAYIYTTWPSDLRMYDALCVECPELYRCVKRGKGEPGTINGWANYECADASRIKSHGRASESRKLAGKRLAANVKARRKRSASV
jgi:hypothetical protein